MTGPIIVGSIYSLFVIVLSLWKPQVGRFFLGFFFLAMGIGVNLTFVLTSPGFVVDYGRGSWVPVIVNLTDSIIAPNPILFGVLLIVFEATMGVMLLSRGNWVKGGLIGSMAFVLGLILLHPAQIVWAVSVVANLFLLNKKADLGFIGILRRRLRPKDSGKA